MTAQEKKISAIPTVALVGRVNVGKSSLFNRLIEENKAIVSPIPGTTRTSNEALVLWRGKQFRLIDTGGLTFEDDVPLENDIIKQSERAMKEADIIVFVTSAKDGVLPQERELAKRLRRVEIKPVMLVANKVDTHALEKTLTEPEWYKLGLGEPFPVSAASGRNVGDLLDAWYDILDKRRLRSPLKQKKAEEIKVSIIGKPNVGKSSLFNKLIGDDRAIVSDIPHTTREPHDVTMPYESYGITFIDTAGIRRKSKVEGSLERAGISKSLDTIGHSDIALFVLDGTDPISTQDMQLGGLLEKHSRSVIILLNKWDMSEDKSETYRNEAKKLIYAHFPHLDFAPLLLVSGKTGYGVHTIFPNITHVWRARNTQISNGALEHFLKRVTAEHRPSRGKGTRHPELLAMRQINAGPPIFELFIKSKTSLHRSYVHYLENKLREQFDFEGTPIVIRLTKMKK